MSQPVPTTDSSTTANGITPEDSVYLESTDGKAQKNSQLQHIATDDTFGQAEDALTINDFENGTTDANSRNKRREEKHSRWVAEQSTRVREKFDLSPSDNFVASFSAALLSTILLQGRMYITTHHLCFYTKLFGKVTKEAFSYSSLARVKKRRGGLVANAIKVYFTDEELPPVIIGSLNHREKAFSLIQERLRIVNPNAAEPHPEDDDGSTGSVASTPIESEEITAASARPMSGNPPPMLVRELESPALSSHSDENAGAAPEINQPPSQLLRIEPIESLQTITSIPDEPPVPEIDEWERSLVWRTPNDIVGNPIANVFDKKAERARIVLKAPIKEVFNVLYISDWLKEYHQEVKNYEVEIGAWVKDDEGGMCRDVSFRRPIGYKLGPKETRVNEKQRYIYTDQGGVLVEVQGRNLDVPCSSYFVVESFFDMSPVNDGRHTLFVASVAVNFVKSTFLQGKIEGGTLTETKTAYGRLIGLAERKIDQHVAERAANKITTKSIQMHRQELANGHVVDNGSSELDSQCIVNEIPEPQNVNRVVRQVPMPTSEENRADHSYEVVSRETHSRPLPDAATNGFASNVVNTKVDTETDTNKAQQSDALHFYRKASVFLLVVACVLLLIVIILLIRVQGLLNSLEKIIDMLKDTDSDKQC